MKTSKSVYITQIEPDKPQSNKSLDKSPESKFPQKLKTQDSDDLLNTSYNISEIEHIEEILQERMKYNYSALDKITKMKLDKKRRLCALENDISTIVLNSYNVSSNHTVDELSAKIKSVHCKIQERQFDLDTMNTILKHEKEKKGYLDDSFERIKSEASQVNNQLGKYIEYRDKIKSNLSHKNKLLYNATNFLDIFNMKADINLDAKRKEQRAMEYSLKEARTGTLDAEIFYEKLLEERASLQKSLSKVNKRLKFSTSQFIEARAGLLETRKFFFSLLNQLGAESFGPLVKRYSIISSQANHISSKLSEENRHKVLLEKLYGGLNSQLDDLKEQLKHKDISIESMEVFQLKNTIEKLSYEGSKVLTDVKYTEKLLNHIYLRIDNTTSKSKNLKGFFLRRLENRLGVVQSEKKSVKKKYSIRFVSDHGELFNERGYSNGFRRLLKGVKVYLAQVFKLFGDFRMEISVSVSDSNSLFARKYRNSTGHRAREIISILSDEANEKFNRMLQKGCDIIERKAEFLEKKRQEALIETDRPEIPKTPIEATTEKSSDPPDGIALMERILKGSLNRNMNSCRSSYMLRKNIAQLKNPRIRGLKDDSLVQDRAVT